ncbi:MAG TPA: hypothetical protein VE129_00175 [Thermoanaerobaculia bacterium]|nr:hypothetical protein [Thermoanaerobaculia bacterium]
MAQKPAARSGVSPAIRDAAKETAIGFLKGKAVDSAFGQSSYARAAFLNPYNLSLLGGAAAASLLTLNPLPILGAVGLEVLWLLWAPDSKRLRHLLWDPRFAKLKEAIEAEERGRLIAGLPEADRERVEALVARRKEIEQLAAQNPTFTGELLRAELVKTDRLVHAFVEMALTCGRYASYLDSVDERVLARDVERYAAEVRRGKPEDQRTEISQKNLAIVVKRQERMHEIQSYMGVARGQLDLIENTFQLIADQIVTMQSPKELSGQLDELLEGVEAIKQSARDTEAMLEASGLSNP